MKLHGTGFVLALALLSAGPAAGDEPAAPVRPWYDTITINGFVEASYSHNFNRPPSGMNGLRVFDVQDATWMLDQVELVAQRAVPDTGGPGFRMDFVAGSRVPRVEAASGLFRDVVTGEAGDLDIQQAYVSYAARAGRLLRVDVGKFVTPLGFEVIDGYDGFNDHVTRSFLFGYAIPFTHTGIRLTYPVSDRITTQLMVVNGWDNARDNNSAPSFGGQLGWAPSGSASVTLNAIAGPEQSGDNTRLRSVVDLVATFRPSPRLALGANADLGREDAPTAGARGAQWTGFAGYARFQLSGLLALAARAEVFDDRDGVRTGTAQTLREFTLTPELRLPGNLVVRADLRHDASDAAVFEQRTGMKKIQTTLMAGVAWPF